MRLQQWSKSRLVVSKMCSWVASSLSATTTHNPHARKHTLSHTHMGVHACIPLQMTSPSKIRAKLLDIWRVARPEQRHEDRMERPANGLYAVSGCVCVSVCLCGCVCVFKWPFMHNYRHSRETLRPPFKAFKMNYPVTGITITLYGQMGSRDTQ